MDLERVTIKYLLKYQDAELYSKLNTDQFTGFAQSIFQAIQEFYKAHQKIPSIDEIRIKTEGNIPVNHFFINDLITEEIDNLQVGGAFLAELLRDKVVKSKTLDQLEKVVTNIEHMAADDLIEQINNISLDLSSLGSNREELIDVGEMDLFTDDPTFTMYPSGLSLYYDEVNNGFGTQELILLGGMRGSGKSILLLNCLLHRFKMGHTTALLSIEMRYKEIVDRMMSILSGVPFLDILKNKLPFSDKLKIAQAKAQTFYEESIEMEKAIERLGNSSNLKLFNSDISKCPMKANRFLIIDDEQLTLAKVDHHNNVFKNKYPNYSFCGVDYLNIIQGKDKMDWKQQIEKAEGLKTFSRKYDLTMMSPYQISMDGEARFAKGILDSADRSFIFNPATEDAPNIIKVYTSKIRNGKAVNFELDMLWECVRVQLEHTQPVSGKLLTGERYGAEEQKDLKQLDTLIRDSK